jgi:hypothetical protein
MEIKDIISNLNKKVIYNGSEYILNASTIRKNRQSKIFYQAELLDRNQNCVYIVRLEDIKCCTESE